MPPKTNKRDIESQKRRLFLTVISTIRIEQTLNTINQIASNLNQPSTIVIYCKINQEEELEVSQKAEYIKERNKLNHHKQKPEMGPLCCTLLIITKVLHAWKECNGKNGKIREHHWLNKDNKKNRNNTTQYHKHVMEGHFQFLFNTFSHLYNYKHFTLLLFLGVMLLKNDSTLFQTPVISSRETIPIKKKNWFSKPKPIP